MFCFLFSTCIIHLIENYTVFRSLFWASKNWKCRHYLWYWSHEFQRRWSRFGKTNSAKMAIKFFCNALPSKRKPNVSYDAFHISPPPRNSSNWKICVVEAKLIINYNLVCSWLSAFFPIPDIATIQIDCALVPRHSTYRNSQSGTVLFNICE